MERQQELVAKIVLLGDAGVGKSSLLGRYTKGEFTHRYVATIGADFTTKDVHIDKKRITLQIWDTAGHERFQSLGTAFYRGADCCILTFDVNVASTFANLARWRQEFLIQAAPNDPDQFPFIVIGNKIDKPERAVTKKEVLSWCESNNIDFFETSAKDGSGVESAFEVAAQHAVAHHMLDVNTLARNGLDDKISLTDDRRFLPTDCASKC